MDETAKPDTGGHRATTRSHRDARAEALQKALRENLRRRKASTAAEKPEPDPTAADDGEIAWTHPLKNVAKRNP